MDPCLESTVAVCKQWIPSGRICEVLGIMKMEGGIPNTPMGKASANRWSFPGRCFLSTGVFCQAQAPQQVHKFWVLTMLALDNMDNSHTVIVLLEQVEAGVVVRCCKHCLGSLVYVTFEEDSPTLHIQQLGTCNTCTTIGMR